MSRQFIISFRTVESQVREYSGSLPRLTDGYRVDVFRIRWLKRCEIIGIDVMSSKSTNQFREAPFLSFCLSAAFAKHNQCLLWDKLTVIKLQIQFKASALPQFGQLAIDLDFTNRAANIIATRTKAMTTVFTSSEA